MCCNDLWCDLNEVDTSKMVLCVKWVNCECMRVDFINYEIYTGFEIFSHPSYKGNSTGFFKGFEFSLVIWIHLICLIYISLALRVCTCFYCDHVHFGCSLDYLEPSIFWHLEWLGQSYRSTFYFKWTRAAV